MKIGVIGRWKPFHLGGALLLDSICERTDHLIIGIGSSNKYNYRCPFTAEETEGMIRSYMDKSWKGKYDVVHIPDFGHIPEYRDGKKWTETVHGKFGDLDVFVSGDKYVLDLLSDIYLTTGPATYIPYEKRVFMTGTSVRVEMAKGGNWKELVPPEVAQYIVQQKLDERLRKEFGLQILAETMGKDYNRSLSAEEERILTTDDGGVRA
ncbi:MAG: hypothetical protein V1725_04715 [archaeon]